MNLSPFALVLALAISSNLFAQPQPSSSDADKRFLAFRAQDWKTTHDDDPAQVKEHVQLLRQLKCQVQTHAHAGHTDIQYKTTFWKLLALDTEQQVDQWERWLQANQFETIYGRKTEAPATTNEHAAHEDTTHEDKVGEIVKYRSPDWNAQHADESREKGQFLTLFRALGCETETVEHGDHSDVRYRCPDWRQIELGSHETAHAWQKFLDDAGFETAHQH